jgi:hypothetical protein
MLTDTQNAIIKAAQNGSMTISYNERMNMHEELLCIAGVLDMIFLINEADMWDNRSSAMGASILDARNRASMLADMM